MVTQLRPLESPPAMDGVLRALVEQASTEIVKTVLPMFTESFRRMVEQVNAQAPNVMVAAPPAPQVAVNPEITVQPADMGELAASLSRIERLLTELVTALKQPTTTRVARDADKLITEVVTSR